VLVGEDEVAPRGAVIGLGDVGGGHAGQASPWGVESKQ
jgi:hypothetical protein